MNLLHRLKFNLEQGGFNTHSRKKLLRHKVQPTLSASFGGVSSVIFGQYSLFYSDKNGHWPNLITKTVKSMYKNGHSDKNDHSSNKNDHVK